MDEAASGSDNYYALLNVSRDASQDDIRRAYRALAAVAHPDKHADDVSTASANFVRVQAAYEVRGSAAKRCCLHCLVSLDLRKVKGAVAESVRRHTTQHSVRERRLAVHHTCSCFSSVSRPAALRTCGGGGSCGARPCPYSAARRAARRCSHTAPPAASRRCCRMRRSAPCMTCTARRACAPGWSSARTCATCAAPGSGSRPSRCPVPLLLYPGPRRLGPPRQRARRALRRGSAHPALPVGCGPC